MAENNIVKPEDNPFFEKEVQKQSTNRKLLNIAQGLIVMIFVMIIVYLFIATPNQVDGLSMFPNFDDGQLLLTNQIPRWVGGSPLGNTLGAQYQRGNVVVVKKENLDKLIIKRIVGLPGEEISIVNGKFYIDGRQLVENYLSSDVVTSGGSFLLEGQSKIIPENSYFVSGDNRPHSLDSRSAEIGFVSKDQLQGIVIVRFWPLSVFSFIPVGTASLAPAF